MTRANSQDHKVNLFSKILAVALAAAAAPLMTPTLAHARSQAAFLGHEYDGKDVACFFEANGGPVKQACGKSEAAWVMPMVYDSDGPATIRVSASGSSTGSVTCRAYTARWHGAMDFGTIATTQNNGASEELFVSVPWAHGFGGLWVTCTLGEGTRLYNVHY